MKKKIWLFFLFVNLHCFSQITWEKMSSTNNHKVNYNEQETIMKVNFSDFQKIALQARTKKKKKLKKEKPIIVELPDKKGNLISFKIYENPVFSESLSKKYPKIKSFVGYDTNNKGIVLRMSTSPRGVQTMISFIDKPTVFMMPAGNINTYRVYNKTKKRGNFICKTPNNFSKRAINKNTLRANSNDKILRTFRIAISVTGEYTQYHGGTVAGALAAINATLTRVNAVYETDLAVRFELIDATELIFTNPESDPYSVIDNWNVELQNTLSKTIGNKAYDIGHLFGASGGGGNAGCIGCVCKDDDINNLNDINKGGGITSPDNGKPEGAAFDIDYVTHEIGHQMGAYHTFAYETEGFGVNCEPGSGSTIMGYAGVAKDQNIQDNTDPYFHYYSIKQIASNIATNSMCWKNNNPIKINNNPPKVNAGANYHIPKGTPYILKGNAYDSNTNDKLTYCWEQIDDGKVTTHNFGPNLTKGSMNRSLPPSENPNRYIPKLSSVIANKLTQSKPEKNSNWETVSNVARELNWALTVRDRNAQTNPNNGQTNSDTMKIIVEDTPPFTMNSIKKEWMQNTHQEVTWNVGETNKYPINCKKVRIKLSVDGGKTFKTIVEQTENSGKEIVLMPLKTKITKKAYIMVEAADNIFFTVSKQFAITKNNNFLPNYVLFPNPSNGVFNIHFANAKPKISIKIIDTNGRIIFRKTFFTNAEKKFYKKLNFSNISISKGLYFVEIQNGNEKVFKKALIK